MKKCDLKKILQDHNKWISSGKKSGRADFYKINLSGENLSGVNLFRANFSGADLSGADLSKADLTGAIFENTICYETNLYGTRLCGAFLRTTFSKSNLSRANFTVADLSRTIFSESDLSNADFTGSDLYGTKFPGTNLSGTYLDPNMPVPSIPDREIISAGLEIYGEYVVGYRTQKSQHCGNIVYIPGTLVIAPYLSKDINMVCHPGIYLAGMNWLMWQYPNSDYVKVKCRRDELIHAGDKWRARRLWVISDKE